MMTNRWVIRTGQFLFKHRNAVFPVALLIILVFLPPQLAWANTAGDSWLDALGILIIFSGLAMRGLVIGLQYIKRGGLKKRVYADELVTGGIFAASRNPLYVGNTLLAIGILVMAGNLWGLLVGSIVTVAAYHAIVAAEEDFLLRKFGDTYRHYCASTNRWLLAPGRVIQALSETEFNWPRVLVKDYNTVFIWLTAALAMLTYEHITMPAYQQSYTDQIPLGIIFIVLSSAYVTTRVLKKSRLLTADGWRTNNKNARACRQKPAP